MQKIKKERGITLIALVITAVVLLLISTPIVVRTTKLTETKKYTNFRDDMLKLKENISILYDVNDDISTIGPIYTGNKTFLTTDVKSPNDQEPYYVIDFNKLAEMLKSKYNLELGELKTETDNINLGDTTENSSDNVYIINSKSRAIYYNKGLNYNKQIFYRLNEDFSNIEQTELPESSLRLYENDNEISDGSTLEITLNINEENYKDMLPVITAKNGDAIMYTFKPANDLKIDITKAGVYEKTYRAWEAGKKQVTVTIKVTVQ